MPSTSWVRHSGEPLDLVDRIVSVFNNMGCAGHCCTHLHMPSTLHNLATPLLLGTHVNFCAGMLRSQL
jgi:hypothetical protein